MLVDPAIVQRFTQLGFDAAGGTPAAFADMVRADSQRWAKVVRDNDIKAD